MSRLNLRVHALARPEGRDDEGLCHDLVEVLRGAVKKRAAPPVAVVLRDGRTDLFQFEAVREAAIPIPNFIAALSCSTCDDGSRVSAVGMMGVVTARRREEPNAPGVPMAICFIEWPDNRWWFFKALVDPENAQIREDTAVILRAVEGDPMPGRLGRWWALGRRAGMHLHLNRTAPSDATPVH